MKSNFTKVIESQHNLNEGITPHWKDNLSSLSLYTAMFTEVAEYVNIQKWKWWKENEEGDIIESSKEELVDIFHFLLSFSMMYIHKVEPYNSDENKILGDILTSSYSVVDKSSNPIYDLYFMLSCLFEMVSNYEAELCGAVEENPFVLDSPYLADPINYFWRVVNKHFDSLNEFLKYYYNKLILNSIRQELGYKNGTYNKNAFYPIKDSTVINKLSKGVSTESYKKYCEDLRDKFITEYNTIR